MVEFTIGDHRYEARKLNAVEQFHVNRRLAPLLIKSGEARAVLAAFVRGEPMGDDPLSRIAPFVEALGDMKEDDADYVLKVCLGATKRAVTTGGAGWLPITAGNGMLMMPDIDMMVMLQIVFHVVQGNLGNFMPGSASSSTGSAPARK